MATPQLVPNICMMCGHSQLLPGSSFCKGCFPLMFPNATKTLKNLDKVNPEQFRAMRKKAVTFAESALENLSAPQLGEAVAKYMLLAEANYRKTLFYGADKPRCFQGKANGFRATNMMIFDLAAKETPATAIQKFFEGETVCECHSLIIAVFYRAVLSLVGDSCFNILFPDIRVEGGAFFLTSKNPIKHAWTEFEVMQDGSNIELGDWVYCVNRSDYKKKHPRGEAGGWNLVCVNLNPRRYLGFGLATVGKDIGMPTLGGPLTLEQVLDVLKRCYELDPAIEDPRQKDLLKSVGVDMPTVTRGSAARLDPNTVGKRLDSAKLKWLLARRLTEKEIDFMIQQ